MKRRTPPPKARSRLTQKELAFRWHCSLRTVRREIRRWKLWPVDFIGATPVFEQADVERMEARRKDARTAVMFRGHQGERLLTVKEAKRLAGKGSSE